MAVGGQAVEWSDEIYRMFGVSRGEFTPRLDEIIALIHPEGRECVRDALTRSVTHRSGFDFDFQLHCPDDEMRHLWAEGHCGLTEEDEVAHVFGICRNITEQQQAEALLRAARDTAEAASRAKSDFLASMSHELRTSLNAILGFSDLLRTEVIGSLGDRYREYAADIHRSGRHLLDRINDRLDMARIEARRWELHDACLAPWATQSGRPSVWPAGRPARCSIASRCIC
jgi:signal transduction histidine kinase